jgi:quinolinate synthase
MYDRKDIIAELRQKTNSVILAHNYQSPEIQDIADFTGDSLELSRKAAATEAGTIVFCGVDFMAETAKILSPDKKVILPVRDATCPMANMIMVDDLNRMKEQHRGVPVVTYVNTTAQIKARSDICCTSSNAVNVVNSLKSKDIIFTPDRNLGSYVSSKSDKNLILWPGFCPVHDEITREEVVNAKKNYPGAVFMAHPECRKEVLELADYIVSTGQMFSVAAESDAEIFLVGTEEGIVYPLKKKFREKEFVPVRPGIVCKNMKKITLDKVIESMKTASPEVTVPRDIIGKAARALNRMLEIS